MRVLESVSDGRSKYWKFSLTNAPWYGGFWERLVSVVTVGKACLNFYELEIVLSEVELILNSRPLNHLCDDDTSDIKCCTQQSKL